MLTGILVGLSWMATILCSWFLFQAFLLWTISLFRRAPRIPVSASPRSFGIIIPAYDTNLPMAAYLVDSIIRTRYPGAEILIIADGGDHAGFTAENPALQVVIPPVRLSSKIHSIRFALDKFSNSPEGYVILDPDNLVHKDFFSNINRRIASGFRVVQGIRIAKNSQSGIARADALGEYYHNFADRLVPFRVGSSPTISGSGFYIDRQLLQRFFSSEKFRQAEKNIILGEDKLLQNYLVLNGERLAFEKDAIVFDEKIIRAGQVRTQRARWINSYYENLPGAMALLTRGLISLDINSLVLGLISIKPPLVILFVASLITAAGTMFVNPVMTMIIAGSTLVFCFYFVFASIHSPHASKVGKAFLSLPKFVYHQFFAALQGRRHRGEFKVTDNRNAVGIDEMNDTGSIHNNR